VEDSGLRIEGRDMIGVEVEVSPDNEQLSRFVGK